MDNQETSPLVGFAILVVAGVIALWLLGGSSQPYNPEPRPSPRPDVLASDFERLAETAGKVEDRLYAKGSREIGEGILSGKYETTADWHRAADKMMHDARVRAFHDLHKALDSRFGSGEASREDEAQAWIEMAEGFERSGR